MHEGDLPTFAAWSHYLETTTADAVFILGDLFEVWVGDDVLDLRTGFEKQCADRLCSAAQDLDIFMMPGNRDFLMGPRLMHYCNSTLLADPTVLTFGGERWLLSHGDALCLDDTAYIKFRSMVRSRDWEDKFLQQQLPERIRQAAQMRAQSEAKKSSGFVYADVNTPAAIALLQHHQAWHMVHGHTHQPGVHQLAPGSNRYVLSDWDACASPPRGEIFRITLSSKPDAPAVQAQRVGVDITKFSSSTPRS